MLYKKEFPDYDDELWIPEGFTDASYHNDICPHVYQTMRTWKAEGYMAETRVLIWEDYKNVELREYDDGKKYVFQIEVDGDTVFSYESDDKEKIIDLIDGIV